MCSITFAQKAKKLGYIFDNTTYNFGDIAMWENQPAFFTFTNQTKESVTILPVFSEVDLEVIYPEGEILPGESVTIKAIFYTSGEGTFNRSFPLYFSTYSEAITLKITGDIKKLSPNAYIQCPHAKPELAKQKSELFINVTDILSDIPLNNVLVKIIDLNTNQEEVFITDKHGNLDTKLTQGNYEVIIEHPQYQPHQNFLYISSKPSSYLRLSLKPLDMDDISTPPTTYSSIFGEEDIPTKEENINQDSISTYPIHEEPITIEPNSEEESINPVEAFVGDNDNTPSTEEPTSLNNEEPIAESPPIYTYNYTPPEYTPPVIEDVVIEKKHSYTISVLDKETYLPIYEANVYMYIDMDSLIQTGKTDAMGYYSTTMKKAQYRVTAAAPGYNTGEILIDINAHENDIHRIFLEKKTIEPTPISTINSTIAEEEEMMTEVIPIAPLPPKDTIIVEKDNTEAIDSLMQVINQLEEENNELQTPEEILSVSHEKPDTELKVDSMEALLAELQEKFDNLENQLNDADTSPPLEEDTLYESELSREDYAANNILFLIDISNSMGKENKMTLLKESINSLVTVLRDIDRVAIIAYNQYTDVVLHTVKGDETTVISNAISELTPSGLTYGVNGIQKAYEMLEYYFIGDGNNQIILATDGLFSSVNNTMTEGELNKLVKRHADDEITMSVVGFGKDEDGLKLMEKLAKNGKGQFIQIKNEWETQHILIDEIKLNSKKK